MLWVWNLSNTKENEVYGAFFMCELTLMMALEERGSVFFFCRKMVLKNILQVLGYF
jgi:hypothetical protein